MRAGGLLTATCAALLLGALPLVAAHGHESMDMTASTNISLLLDPDGRLPSERALSYFRHPGYAGWMYAHIALMIASWVYIMPVAIMLSIARSRYHLPAQVVFHITNGLGLFTSFVYNHATPDLYENNAHHPIGWIAMSFTVVWTLASLFVAYGEHKSRRASAAQHPMTSGNMAQYDRLHQYVDSPMRLSRDSGQGTERNSTSLFGNSRQNSSEAIHQKPEDPEAPLRDESLDDEDVDEEPEKRGFLGNNKVDRFISRHVLRFTTPRASTAIRISQIVLEKLLLLLGFFALTTGFVNYGGIFRGMQVFSGAAHFAKGGIFFWYGLLTLGRWMGAFSEFGWAWNLRPSHPSVARWKTKVPSAEFTESFVIWLYGASNVFLEHLDNPGGAWRAQDLEHVSITLLFFGGGLLGMLIESSRVREFLNTTVVVQKAELAADASRFAVADPSAAEELWEQPSTYNIPLNPLPGLVIMLLGIMMSSHHQHSMVSTMMHSQWGTLFVAFALARGVTYITMFLRPPTSHFPSRPPSELIAAFCLTAGGLIFMVSASDTVYAIESNGLDAMPIFTVGMGLTATLLAWEVVCFSIKGWAVRKERAAPGRPIA